jgi:hypothetical protein
MWQIHRMWIAAFRPFFFRKMQWEKCPPLDYGSHPLLFNQSETLSGFPA